MVVQRLSVICLSMEERPYTTLPEHIRREAERNSINVATATYIRYHPDPECTQHGYGEDKDEWLPLTDTNGNIPGTYLRVMCGRGMGYGGTRMVSGSFYLIIFSILSCYLLRQIFHHFS